MYHRLRFNKSWKQVHDYIPEEMFPCDYPGGKAPSIKELRGSLNIFKLMQIFDLFLVISRKMVEYDKCST